jgi:hypothetical protein
MAKAAGRSDIRHVSIAETNRIANWSRSETYRRLAAGKFTAVKCGTRTLVVLDSLLRHLESLPIATFRAPPEKLAPNHSSRAEPPLNARLKDRSATSRHMDDDVVSPASPSAAIMETSDRPETSR